MGIFRYWNISHFYFPFLNQKFFCGKKIIWILLTTQFLQLAVIARAEKCVLPTLFIWKYWSKISGKSIPCFGCKGLMGKVNLFFYFHGLNWWDTITKTFINFIWSNFHEGWCWLLLRYSFYFIHKLSISACTKFIGPHLS